MTDVGAGAGAQSRAADCHIVIREHEDEGVFVLDAAVRSFPPVKPLGLRWKYPVWLPDVDVDPRKLAGLGTKSEESKKVKDKEGFDAITKALQEEPATANALGGKVGIGRERLKRLLGKMVCDNLIVSREVTIRNNACQEYRLQKPDE